MKIAFFNIAWESNQDEIVATLLSKYKISGVELAASKIWVNPEKVSDKQAQKYRKFWNSQGIEIVALCSLLFPHTELNIFQNNDIRDQTLKYLEKIANLGRVLGAKVLVFGSPKNRNYQGLTSQEVQAIADHFFYQLALIGQKYQVIFCLEPIPAYYDTNFVNTTAEAVKLVKRINHPYFQLHLDSGAMTMNKEDYEASIKLGKPYIKHFHISEDFLEEVGTGTVDHQHLARLLKHIKYDGWVSVEIPKKNDDQDSLAKIERVLKFVKKIYI